MTRLELQRSLEVFPPDSEVQVVLRRDDGTWETRGVSLVAKHEGGEAPLIVPYEVLITLHDVITPRSEG